MDTINIEGVQGNLSQHWLGQSDAPQHEIWGEAEESRGGEEDSFFALSLPPPDFVLNGGGGEFHGSAILLARKVGCQFSRFLPKKKTTLQLQLL